MPHAPIIRRATAADIGALLALEEATFSSDRISRRQWRRHVAGATAQVLVADAAAAVHGAAVVLYRRGSGTARLYSLAVRAGQRGGGLGGALLAAAEADARGRSCTAMSLEVRTRNRAAIALYERCGYTRVMRVPRYYEDGADAWRYRKCLAAA